MSSNDGADTGASTTTPPADGVSTITGPSARSTTGGGRRGQGSGRGGSGRGGDNNNRNNQNNNNNNNNNKTSGKEETTEKYEGETTELKDHVFKLVQHKVAAVTCKNTLERIARYAETEYKSHLMKLEIMTGVVQKPKLPEQEKDSNGVVKTDRISEALFSKRLEKYVSKEEHLENARSSMCSIIWGQCSPTAGLHSAMLGTAPDPASDHLFDINEENPVKLNSDRSDLFHTLVAKMLFVAKRARPDIQQAVAFLTTRVSSPDEDDWKKLGRVVQYLRQYPDLPLTLEADNTHVVKWWVDASFAVHRDMKSQTGATMSLGKGCPYSTSTRQKLNTTSSTEAELVGVADVMPMVLWTRHFLEAQGYGVDENVVYQDNKSAILLEKNGRASSSKRTRHINIRYFFIADRVHNGEVTVEYCPTDEMLGDIYTKPLSGEKFKRFRAAIMNIPLTE